MKKFISLITLIFLISISTFASNSLLNLPKDKQEILVTKGGKEIKLSDETLNSLTFCGSGYVVDSNGNVIGDWFYCDSFNGDGSFVFRITIW